LRSGSNQTDPAHLQTLVREGKAVTSLLASKLDWGAIANALHMPGNRNEGLELTYQAMSEAAGGKTQNVISLLSKAATNTCSQH
jgi:hypothetical protein